MHCLIHTKNFCIIPTENKPKTPSHKWFQNYNRFIFLEMTWSTNVPQINLLFQQLQLLYDLDLKCLLKIFHKVDGQDTNCCAWCHIATLSLLLTLLNSGDIFFSLHSLLLKSRNVNHVWNRSMIRKIVCLDEQLCPCCKMIVTIYKFRESNRHNKYWKIYNPCSDICMYYSGKHDSTKITFYSLTLLWLVLRPSPSEALSFGFQSWFKI